MSLLCTNCGTINDDGATKCTHCRMPGKWRTTVENLETPLPKPPVNSTCRNCGSDLATTNERCSNCHVYPGFKLAGNKYVRPLQISSNGLGHHFEWAG